MFIWELKTPKSMRLFWNEVEFLLWEMMREEKGKGKQGRKEDPVLKSATLKQESIHNFHQETTQK